MRSALCEGDALPDVCASGTRAPTAWREVLARSRRRRRRRSRRGVHAATGIEWFISQAAIAKLGAVLGARSRIGSRRPRSTTSSPTARRARSCSTPKTPTRWRACGPNEPRERRRASSVRLVLSVMRSQRARRAVVRRRRSARGRARAALRADAPRSIVYTSGTTGRPRGVVHARPPKSPKPARSRSARDPSAPRSRAHARRRQRAQPARRAAQSRRRSSQRARHARHGRLRVHHAALRCGRGAAHHRAREDHDDASSCRRCSTAS